MGLTLLTERYAPQITSDRRGAFLLGSDLGFRHAAENLLRRGNDIVFVRTEDPDLRLRKVRGAVSQHAGGKIPSGWRPTTASRSSSCANAMCGKKIGSKRCWPSAATIRDWYVSCRRWNHARPTSRGTTRTPARPICCPMMASVCTNTSISSTKSWGCATYGCLPGCRAGRRSISMGTVG